MKVIDRVDNRGGGGNRGGRNIHAQSTNDTSRSDDNPVEARRTASLRSGDWLKGKSPSTDRTVSLRATDYQALAGHPYSQRWTPPPAIGDSAVEILPAKSAQRLGSSNADMEKSVQDADKSLDDDGGLRVVNGSVEGEGSVSSTSVNQALARGEVGVHDDAHDSGVVLHKRVEKGYEITGIPPLEGLPTIRDLENETEDEKEWYRVVEQGLFRVAEKYADPDGK